ncbi:hypothetical protein C0J52_19518, partial [Blattella germanica]
AGHFSTSVKCRVTLSTSFKDSDIATRDDSSRPKISSDSGGITNLVEMLIIGKPVIMENCSIAACPLPISRNPFTILRFTSIGGLLDSFDGTRGLGDAVRICADPLGRPRRLVFFFGGTGEMSYGDTINEAVDVPATADSTEILVVHLVGSMVLGYTIPPIEIRNIIGTVYKGYVLLFATNSSKLASRILPESTICRRSCIVPSHPHAYFGTRVYRKRCILSHLNHCNQVLLQKTMNQREIRFLNSVVLDLERRHSFLHLEKKACEATASKALVSGYPAILTCRTIYSIFMYLSSAGSSITLSVGGCAARSEPLLPSQLFSSSISLHRVLVGSVISGSSMSSGGGAGGSGSNIFDFIHFPSKDVAASNTLSSSSSILTAASSSARGGIAFTTSNISSLSLSEFSARHSSISLEELECLLLVIYLIKRFLRRRGITENVECEKATTRSNLKSFKVDPLGEPR